jgi:hypothetical protein
MMKSNAFGVGDINLKGRKSKRLRCGCCTAYNFKEKCLKKQHKKDMNNFDKKDDGYEYYLAR